MFQFVKNAVTVEFFTLAADIYGQISSKRALLSVWEGKAAAEPARKLLFPFRPSVVRMTTRAVLIQSVSVTPFIEERKTGAVISGSRSPLILAALIYARAGSRNSREERERERENVRCWEAPFIEERKTGAVISGSRSPLILAALIYARAGSRNSREERERERENVRCWEGKTPAGLEKQEEIRLPSQSLSEGVSQSVSQSSSSLRTPSNGKPIAKPFFVVAPNVFPLSYPDEDVVSSTLNFCSVDRSYEKYVTGKDV
ncbi:unnamed protein product [Notodromas monacha]|uniref:Uncharacterized protein n=1 Tax=Notodromas monacha TaxID=399045 RepID=A0A7R9BL94_9CRUS|nr:unnamed protein product [Notodromas monacha]CAG0916720.1 unnamed protein product [Notodromas monacha]